MSHLRHLHEDQHGKDAPLTAAQRRRKAAASGASVAQNQSVQVVKHANPAQIHDTMQVGILFRNEKLEPLRIIHKLLS